jgi:hypothetical protein
MKPSIPISNFGSLVGSRSDIGDQTNYYFIKLRKWLMTLWLIGPALALNLCSQTFLHPTSGFEAHTLGPGTYQYYDNGGANGNYGNNISSGISFIPAEGCFIYWRMVSHEIENNAASCGGSCCDVLSRYYQPVCGDLGQSTDYCGTGQNFGLFYCGGESLSYNFTSNGSITLAGWHVEIIIKTSTASNILCNVESSCEYEVGGFLTCNQSPIFQEFYCFAFGNCTGAIDYYPECTNTYYPGKERVYGFNLDDESDITINCGCVSAAFIMDVFNCLEAHCLQGEEENGGFVFHNVPAGFHYLSLEIECGGDLCSCDFSFECEPPSGGGLDCDKQEPVECGDVISSSNSVAAGGVNNEVDYCFEGDFDWTGRERVYSYHAEATGTIAIRLENLSQDLDVFLLEGCEANSCVGSSQNGNDEDEFFEANVVEGEDYFIVIDGYEGAQSNYTLLLECESGSCTDCGSCFTYSIMNKGLTSIVNCHPKFEDCNVAEYPSDDHTFQWTVNGVIKSTQYAPLLSLETGRKVKVCQVVKYQGTMQYRCCWDIQPKPGCAKPPVAHAEQNWITTEDIIHDASTSSDGVRYYFDFGDGTNLFNNGIDPNVQHHYPSGSYKWCTYAENDYGISSYCKSFNPGAIECASNQNPQFTYIINNRTITIQNVGESTQYISNYKIDYGDSTTNAQGANWMNRSHTFVKDGTYEICIRFSVTTDGGIGPCVLDGCVCFTVRINCCEQVVNQCSDIRPVFVAENAGLQYYLEYPVASAQVLSWEIDGIPVLNSNSNTISKVFPSAGYYNVCCYYQNPNGCFVKCCKRIYVNNPFNCGLVTYEWQSSSNGYRFVLNESPGNAQEILWSVDNPQYQTLGTAMTSNILTIPAETCKEYVISVRYYDVSCSCYRLCCLRFYLCDPDLCAGVIGVQLIPNGETKFYTTGNYQDIKWFANGQLVGTGPSKQFNTNGVVEICLQYYDPVSKCYRQCCRSFTTAISSLNILEQALIFPNPAREELIIQLTFIMPTQIGITLINNWGQKVLEIPMSKESMSEYERRLDVGQFPPGLYFVHVNTNEGYYTQRIIHL